MTSGWTFTADTHGYRLFYDGVEQNSFKLDEEAPPESYADTARAICDWLNRDPGMVPPARAREPG